MAPLVLLGPLLELAMIAYMGSVPVEYLSTAVLDMDHSRTSRELVVAMENTRTFEASYYLTSLDEVSRYIDRGTALAAIVIPHDFERQLETPQTAPPQVQFIIDGADTTAAQAAVNAAEGVVSSFGQRLGLQPALRSEQEPPPIDISMRVRFNEELKEANYTTPSELGFILGAVVAMVASLGIARERELGTLEQLMVTPLRPLELIIGKAAPAILLGYAEFLLMLAVVILGFGVPMRGSWLLLLVLGFCYLFVELGWGIMISAIAKTQQQALLLVFTVVMVMMVFSGYAFPVDTMHPVFQLISNFFPIKHWLLVLRSILLKGAGLTDFWPQLVALFLLGVAIMTTTVLFLGQKRLD
jgi:ABC-2 type transport system permease protein